MNPQQATYPLPVPPKSKKTTLFLIVLGLLLIGALAFGIWAYMGKSDLQKNTNQKITAAVASAKTAQTATLQAQFDEQSKSPSKTFTGSATYGSVTFNYPKTWSGYLDTSNTGQPLNAYFYPDLVPGTQSGASYALRVEIVNDAYADVLTQYQSQISAGSLTAAAYIPEKLKTNTSVQVGTKFDGLLTSDAKSKGSMVVMRVRDKTLKVYTMSSDFVADYNNTILPSLTFVP